MNWFWIAIYFAFLVATMQLLSFVEKSAALRGTNGKAHSSLLDKGLRIWFLGLFLSPLGLLLPWWLVLIIAVCYVPFYLDGSEKTGDRASTTFRKLKLWRYVGKRFDISLVKEPELEARIAKNDGSQYLFTVHPHGILPFGSIFAVFSELGNFSKEFPGISVRCLAASFVFYLPIYRDICIAVGLIDAARYVARALLEGGKHSLALVPGGATEALYAGNGRHTLKLKNRLGFIRLAMQSGIDVVPVYTFGENNTYDVLDAKYEIVHKIRNKFQRIFGISLPLLLHLLPKKTKITMVFGKPFKCPRIESPTAQQEAEVLEQYIVALRELWNKYKDVYATDRKEELTII